MMSKYVIAGEKLSTYVKKGVKMND